MSGLRTEFRRLYDGLAAIGRDPRGGWTRFAWTAEDRAAREWFRREAAGLGLTAETDRNGNLWAWWTAGDPAAPAVGTGSHLDTVAGGGAYDGALGVISGLLAVGELQARRARPTRPIVVAAFSDEEGGRFGLATCGSRLAAGSLDPTVALESTDGEGIRLAAAIESFGLNPGPDPERLAGLGCYVELHVEQGRGLVELAAPVGVATGIWPHGRWRLTLTGEGNHAGTTRLADRRDPTQPLAAAILAARRHAQEAGGVATMGRILVVPNSRNSVPAVVTAWLDARAPQAARLQGLVDAWRRQVAADAEAHGVEYELTPESATPAVDFDPGLADRLAAVLTARGLPAPRLTTAAGHDAGALAGSVPTGMIFVRNPTGASHTAAESASDADCVTGVEVLTDVLAELACR
jgi:beta-ureidopropionase / N-carbamoyl-L-amino-acid hydrolase